MSQLVKTTRLILKILSEQKKTLYSCVNWALYGTRGPLKRSFHPREAQFTYELVP
jgi:hypothetical protein